MKKISWSTVDARWSAASFHSCEFNGPRLRYGTTSSLLVMVAFIFTACDVLAASQKPVKLRLKNTAEVTSDYVKLSDLVENGEFDSVTVEFLNKVFLGRSPAAGETRMIDREFILRQIARSGHAPHGFVVEGTSVLVSRIPSQDAAERLDFMRKLGQAIESFLRQQLADDQHEISVTVLEVEGEKKSVKFPLEIHEIEQINGDAGTLRVLRLSIASENESSCSLRVVCKVIRKHREFFAKRALPPKKKITAEDIETRLVECSGCSCEFKSADEILGLVTTRHVREGERFEMSFLKKLPVIRRGDSVLVFASVGATLIEVPGRALEDGKVGDIILVENASTRKRFLARVVQEGLVEHLSTGEVRSPMRRKATDRAASVSGLDEKPRHVKEDDK